MRKTYEIVVEIDKYEAHLKMKPGTRASLYDPGDPPEVEALKVVDEDGNALPSYEAHLLVEDNWDLVCEALADAEADDYDDHHEDW